MTTRPRFPALAAVAAGVLALTSCSSTTSGTSSASSADENEQASSGIGAAAAECVDGYDGVLSELPGTYPDPEPAPLTIGFSQPLGANETVAYLERFAEVAAKDLGGSFVAYDAEGQPDKQVTQIQQLINQKVDAILVFPLDATALNPVVAQAEAAGIPVIGMEVSPDPDGDIGQVTTQLVQGRDYHAYIHACTMAKLHPEGEVATIKFAVPVPSINAYADLVTEKATELGLDVVGRADNQSDDVAGGETAASGLLAKHPDLTGIFAYNDPSAIGASTAARTQSRTITSFGLNGGSDGLAAVENGRAALTIQFPLKTWGEEMVKAAYNAVQDPDAPLPQVVFPPGTQVFTEDNIDEAITWEQQHRELTK